MENKNCKNPIYKCGVCGKVYTDVVSRANCELACSKRVAEEKKAAEAKKKEQQTRFDEVNAAYKKADKLMSKYLKDFGHYSYSTKSKEDTDLFNFLNLFM